MVNLEQTDFAYFMIPIALIKDLLFWQCKFHVKTRQLFETLIKTLIKQQLDFTLHDGCTVHFRIVQDYQETTPSAFCWTCVAAQSNQRICCSLLRQYDLSSFHKRNFKVLTYFCHRAGPFVSDMLGDSRRQAFPRRDTKRQRELPHEINGFWQMRKQRCRSAAQ